MGSDGSRSRPKKTKASPRRPKSGSPRSRPRSGPSSPTISPEERHRLIAEAAFYRAERRGFAPGDPMQDWLEAEAEILTRFPQKSVRSGKTASR